ncbi:MAG TPA: transcription elongation factor GreA [Opitutaceae bacterium]|nr:transcription elongation factor GreA [Opitutaceae bacterium]
MNAEAVQDLISQKPDLKPSKAKLEAMKSGAYCVHRSWGFGRIKSYDAANRKLLIDFEGKPGHPMDPAFCVTTLEVLPEKHLLVRKQTEAAKIQDLIENNPAQLVVEALQTYPNNAATGVELENLFSSVIGAEKFKRWWTGAKKQLTGDPRVAVPAKRTEVYVLRDEPVNVEDELVEQFKNTRSPRRRLQIAADLLGTAKKKDLKPVAAGLLADVTAIVKDTQGLELAERLHGAWVRNDLATIAGEDVAALEPKVEELVANERDLPTIAEKLPTGYHVRLLELIHAAHPTAWKEIVFNLLKLSSGKFTTECVNFLIDHDAGAEITATFQRWQVEQNLRAPVLLWIVKNRTTRKFSRLLNELIGPRLLTAILFAIDYEALQTAGARRMPLADILSDDADLIPDLLSTADPETARDLANTLLLNQGFEELTKKSLLARFIKLFPGIQSLVASDDSDKGEALLVSKESHDRKREEYDTIVTKKIPENSKAIAAAREHGDLKENSEYKMAKQDQSLLLAQKGQLERELGNARVTDFKDVTTQAVGVGSVVELRDLAAKKVVTYSILGAWDSDPENNVMSYKTPLGQALLSKKVGDEVKVKIGGEEHTYAIQAIRRYVDGK